MMDAEMLVAVTMVVMALVILAMAEVLIRGARKMDKLDKIHRRDKADWDAERRDLLDRLTSRTYDEYASWKARGDPHSPISTLAIELENEKVEEAARTKEKERKLGPHIEVGA